MAIDDTTPRPGDTDNNLLQKILRQIIASGIVSPGTAGQGLVVDGDTVSFAQSGPYTTGAIPFATGPATMGFDPANLLWDDVENRLVLGIENTLRINTDSAPFVFKADHSTNLGVQNDTLIIGYNVTGLLSTFVDNRIDPTLPGVTFDLETNFSPLGTFTQHEWNHNYLADDGVTYRRGFVYTIRNDTLESSWQWRANAFAWTEPLGVTNWLLASSAGVIVNGSIPNQRLEVVDTSGTQLRLTRDATNYVNLGGSTVGSFTVSPTAGYSQFLASSIRIEGSTAPTTGKGLEIGYTAGSDTATLVSINRSTVAYKLMNFDASTLALNSGSGGKVGVATAAPSVALDVSGVIRAQGSTGASVGKGIEIGYASGTTTGSFISFNRDGGAYTRLNIDGNPTSINGNTGQNIGLGVLTEFGGGTGVIGIKSATVVPSTNPTGGGVLYVQAGALKFRGSSGTVTTIALA
jgi:hypothetical protein